MRTVILADGGRPELATWAGGYRHLIEIEGEVLLHRTVRQFSQLGEVIVVGPYQLPGVRSVKPQAFANWNGIAMFAKALDHLHGDARTNLVFGDVWFSDEAFETIASYSDVEWQVFGRPKPSQITGTGWGEYFCFTLYPHWLRHFERSMNNALSRHRQGFFRCSPWEVYFDMEGLPYEIAHGNPVQTGPHWTTIDDWTDDFDFIEDVLRWRDRRAALAARSSSA